MKLIEDTYNPGTFRWMKGKKIVACITLYPSGLVEYNGHKGVLAIERIGRKDEGLVVEYS
jgi:hypothetical protein